MTQIGTQTQLGANSQSDRKITCLDDVPNIARIAERQRIVVGWYKLIALAPFGVILFIELKFFGNSTSPLASVPIFAALAWAMGIAIYGFYCTFWGVDCPSCGQRFGSLGSSCRSCGLPRHLDLSDLFGSTNQE
jgi:hypothetical protein